MLPEPRKIHKSEINYHYVFLGDKINHRFRGAKVEHLYSSRLLKVDQFPFQDWQGIKVLSMEINQFYLFAFPFK